MNLSLKFGVPFVPSHRAQPEGMLARVPDHITITPLGTPGAAAQPSAAPVALMPAANWPAEQLAGLADKLPALEA